MRKLRQSDEMIELNVGFASSKIDLLPYTKKRRI